MALNDKEMQRLTTLLTEKKGSDFTELKNQTTFAQDAKDFGTGFAQGVGSTVNFASNVASYVNPANAVKNAKSLVNGEPRNYNVFSEQSLTPKNDVQRAGKNTEFLVEIIAPFAVTNVAKAIPGKAITKTKEISKSGISFAKERITSLVDRLDDKTKTALLRTPESKLQEILQKGRDAMLDDRNRTPLEAVGDNVIDGLKQVKEFASNVGRDKQKLLQSLSDDKTLDLRAAGSKKGDLFVPNELAAKVNKTIKSLDEQFANLRLDKGDANLVKEFKNNLSKLGNNPSLSKLDATIDMLQDKIYTSSRNNAVEVTNKVTGMLRKTLGELNGVVKSKAGTEYTKLNDEYSQAIRLINELNARVGKEGGQAGAFVKRLFSPSDARTKALFEELQKYTGEDYFRDARISRFIMESLNDKRAATLLDIPQSKSGVVEGVLKYGLNKISDPIKQAESFIKKNLPSN